MTPAHRASVRAAGSFAAAIVGAIALLELVLLVLRPENGFVGLVQIMSPHVALVGLALVPVAVLGGATRERAAALLLVAVCLVRFGGEWLSVPRLPVGDTDALVVTTWNVEVGARTTAETVDRLRAVDADLVLIQELTTDLSDGIANDVGLAERYPHQALRPSDTTAGLGVLSRHALGDVLVDANPILQSLVADIGGRRVRVVNAHPLRAPFSRFVLGVPTGYSPGDRNEDLEAIRELVDGWIEAGETVVLAGDFNTASSEPAFASLTAGLLDAHAEVGLGTGWTWRPSRLELFGVGLLRLDLVMTGPGLEPAGIDVSCPPRGDHCVVTATLAWTSG